MEVLSEDVELDGGELREVNVLSESLGVSLSDLSFLLEEVESNSKRVFSVVLPHSLVVGL